MSAEPTPRCQLCGEPMPEGEEMFNYHGYSGPCPKPPSSPVEPTPSALERAREILNQHGPLRSGRHGDEWLLALALDAHAKAATQFDVHWAIKSQCPRCREVYPQRHDKADYIPNFGNVESGDWTHPCTLEHDWRFCTSARIHEALFAALRAMKGAADGDK